MNKRAIIIELRSHPEMYIGYRLKCNYKNVFIDTGKIIGIYEHIVVFQCKYFRRSLSYQQMLSDDMLELECTYDVSQERRTGK